MLTYLITWPLQTAAYLLAGDAGIELSNEDNFGHFSDILTGNGSYELWLPFGLFTLGQVGPVVASVVIASVIYGRAGRSDLARRTAAWRVAPRWYGTIVVIPLVLAAASLAVAFVAGGFRIGPFEPKLSGVLFLPFLLYMIVFTGLAEEPGWRGFALPHLQANNTAIRASWILGFAWGLWHVPFTIYFNRDEPLLILPSLLGLTFGIVGWTIVNTWIYNSTRSVLLMALLHGWTNTVQSYLVLSQPSFLAKTLFAVLPWGIAIVLSKRYGDENLSDRERPKWWPGDYPVEQRA